MNTLRLSKFFRDAALACVIAVCAADTIPAFFLTLGVALLLLLIGVALLAAHKATGKTGKVAA